VKAIRTIVEAHSKSRGGLELLMHADEMGAEGKEGSAGG